MITFTNPWFLFVGVALAALITSAFASRARRGRLLVAFLGGDRAAQRLSGHDLRRMHFERISLLVLASLAMASAAAGPRVVAPAAEPELADAPRVQRVMVAIDVSASMQDTDVSPTRLGSAVRIARTLVESMDGSEVGLVLHAGKAYTLTPPTHDHRGVLYLLRGVTPTTVTPWDRGASLAAGIREGVVQLAGADSVGHEGMIILISDAGTSESGGEEAIAAVRGAVASGIQVHTIGIGSVGAGATGSAAFGKPLLRRLAQIGGGTYTDGAPGGMALAVSRGLNGGSSGVTPGAPWNTGDPTFWLTAAALLLVFVDGLLDGKPRRAGRRPSRRAP